MASDGVRLMGPDAFIGDWYGFATNQLGHFMVGLVGFFIVAYIRGSVRWSVAAVLVGYAAWEVFHISIGGTVADSVNDFTFVAIGLAFGVAAWVASRGAMMFALVLAMVSLLDGVLERANERKRK